MIENGELRRPGRRPKSETLGFLTQNKRDFLEMEPEKRRACYSDENYTKIRYDIHDHAKLAIEDLLILVRNSDEKDLKKIISTDDIVPLVFELVKKIGSEKLGEIYSGPFYLHLIKSIEMGIINNKIISKSRETIKIRVESSLLFEKSNVKKG
jgi:hypothetical protein